MDENQTQTGTPHVMKSPTEAAWFAACRNFVQRQLSRRTQFALLALIVLALLHPLVLRLLSWPLQSFDPPTTTDFFCLHGGELGIDGFEALRRASAWQRQTKGTILLVSPRTTRLVEIGAVPSFEQTCRRELKKYGVSEANVETIRGDVRNTWDKARALDDWLKKHPQANVSLACSPFASGRLRYIFNKVLDRRDSARIRLVSLPDPVSGSTSWWRSRTGVKDFMYAWLDMAYTCCVGDDEPAPQPSAAEFQKNVMAEIREAAQ
jgi:hypothetical protein